MSQSTENSERIQREKAFHNEEFAHSAREQVSRFYTVMQASTDFFQAEILRRAEGKTVLEYGCGPGTHSFKLANVASRVVGIDISEVAIEKARERARTRGVGNVEFHVMNAEQLEFPDDVFDLVAGRAIVHHLDVRRCFSTVSRVLKPTGAALFQEPLGHNPLINLYRGATPNLRTVDEHPLLMSDLATAREFFHRVDYRPFILSSLAAAALHGTPLFGAALRLFNALDSGLFIAPFLRRYAWTSVWILEEPKRR